MIRAILHIALKFSPIISLLIICCFSKCTQTLDKDDFPILKIYCADTITNQSKIDARLSYLDHKGVEQFEIKIKRRGGMSIAQPKHSYTIRLNESHKLAGMPKSKNWILNASYIDKTFLRHKLSYDLFQSWDNDNIAAKSVFVEVYLNDEYNGIYILMERLDEDRLEIDKQDKGVCIFKGPPIFFRDSLPKSMIQEPDNYYHQKYPDKNELDMSVDIEGFRQFLFFSSDSVFINNIGDWVDIENIIDWHLLLLLTNNGDGIMKNFYLYKRAAHEPFRIAPWDYDHSMGREGDGELNLIKKVVRCERSILIDRLMALNANSYKQRLKERWQELREKKLIDIGTIDDYIQQAGQELKPYMERNAERWPLDGPFYYDANNFEEEIELLHNYWKLRLPQLEQYFGAGF